MLHECAQLVAITHAGPDGLEGTAGRYGASVWLGEDGPERAAARPGAPVRLATSGISGLRVVELDSDAAYGRLRVKPDHDLLIAGCVLGGVAVVVVGVAVLSTVHWGPEIGSFGYETYGEPAGPGRIRRAQAPQAMSRIVPSRALAALLAAALPACAAGTREIAPRSALPEVHAARTSHAAPADTEAAAARPGTSEWIGDDDPENVASAQGWAVPVATSAAPSTGAPELHAEPTRRRTTSDHTGLIVGCVVGGAVVVGASVAGMVAFFNA
ncbi:MAG TPA: hypothetical protein VHB21_25780 [Minicystis sp.]|nr:hypothetical protein [Minicystis sp.]